MNLWHDVSRGENVPAEVNMIVEIPKNSPNKYEIDKETGLIALDRANYSAAPYPFDYGFAPQTLWDDGDALDIVLLTTYPLHPGILVNVRPVGMMEMIDGGDNDAKIIAVPINDKRWDDVQNITDVNKHTLKEIAHFFETYKELKKGEKGAVQIGNYLDAAAARAAVERSIELYNAKFAK
jgi:inorganic pyrophosphatase